MAKRSATEKLAIEICWKGFATKPPHNGCRTAVQYWNTVGQSAKLRYMEHAAEMIWWTRKLGWRRLQRAVEEHDRLTGRELLTENTLPAA